MRLIKPEEQQLVGGALNGVCTTTPLEGGGSTTSCALNGTTTITTTLANGDSTTVITQKDGHGVIVTNSTEDMRGGEIGGGMSKVIAKISIGGGKVRVTREIRFSADDGYCFELEEFE